MAGGELTARGNNTSRHCRGSAAGPRQADIGPSSGSSPAWTQRCRVLAVGCAVMVLGAGLLTSGVAGAQTPPPGFDVKAFENYSKCLAKRGVELPERSQTTPTPEGSAGQGGPFGPGGPGGGSGGGGGAFFGSGGSAPPGVDQKTYDKAQKKCRSKLPKAFREGNPGGRAQGAFDAYLSCLGDHGVKVPKPTKGKEPRGLPQFDQNDPTFQAADQFCAPLRPTFPGAGTSPTTGA